MSCARTEPPAPPPSPSLHAVKPTVYFQELRAFLPEPPEGYRQVRDRGSTGKYGAVSVSEAERVFARDGGELSVRIVDTTLAGQLAKSIRAAVEDARQRPPADPTAPILLADAVGFVRFDPAGVRAEANLLVGGRYVVAVSSEGVEGTVEVRRLAGSLDLAGLSKLR